MLSVPSIRTGVDICDVRDVWQKLRRSPGLREDVFSPGEIAYCERFPNPAPHYAARYAAKEAFAKAIGLDLLGLELTALELVHDERGRPSLAIRDEAVDARVRDVLDAEAYQFDLSVSHERDFAVALVVILVTPRTSQPRPEGPAS